MTSSDSQQKRQLLVLLSDVLRNSDFRKQNFYSIKSLNSDKYPDLAGLEWDGFQKWVEDDLEFPRILDTILNSDKSTAINPRTFIELHEKPDYKGEQKEQSRLFSRWIGQASHKEPDCKSEQWGLLSKSEQAERWRLFDSWFSHVYDTIVTKPCFTPHILALFVNEKEFADQISSKSCGVHQRLRNYETFRRWVDCENDRRLGVYQRLRGYETLRREVYCENEGEVDSDDEGFPEVDREQAAQKYIREALEGMWRGHTYTWDSILAEIVDLNISLPVGPIHDGKAEFRVMFMPFEGPTWPDNESMTFEDIPDEDSDDYSDDDSDDYSDDDSDNNSNDEPLDPWFKELLDPWFFGLSNAGNCFFGFQIGCLLAGTTQTNIPVAIGISNATLEYDGIYLIHPELCFSSSSSLPNNWVSLFNDQAGVKIANKWDDLTWDHLSDGRSIWGDASTILDGAMVRNVTRHRVQMLYVWPPKLDLLEDE